MYLAHARTNKTTSTYFADCAWKVIVHSAPDNCQPLFFLTSGHIQQGHMYMCAVLRDRIIQALLYIYCILSFASNYTLTLNTMMWIHVYSCTCKMIYFKPLSNQEKIIFGDFAKPFSRRFISLYTQARVCLVCIPISRHNGWHVQWMHIVDSDVWLHCRHLAVVRHTSLLLSVSSHYQVTWTSAALGGGNKVPLQVQIAKCHYHTIWVSFLVQWNAVSLVDNSTKPFQ